MKINSEVKGYKEPTEEQVVQMKQVKAMGAELKKLVDELRQDEAIDKRWLATGTTDLQKGLMCLTRSIIQPDFF